METTHRKQRRGEREQILRFAFLNSPFPPLSCPSFLLDPLFLHPPILICSLGPLWPTKEPAIDVPFLIFQLARSTFALHLRNFKIQIFPDPFARSCCTKNEEYRLFARRGTEYRIPRFVYFFSFIVFRKFGNWTGCEIWKWMARFIWLVN